MATNAIIFCIKIDPAQGRTQVNFNSIFSKYLDAILDDVGFRIIEILIRQAKYVGLPDMDRLAGDVFFESRTVVAILQPERRASKSTHVLIFKIDDYLVLPQKQTAICLPAKSNLVHQIASAKPGQNFIKRILVAAIGDLDFEFQLIVVRIPKVIRLRYAELKVLVIVLCDVRQGIEQDGLSVGEVDHY